MLTNTEGKAIEEEACPACSQGVLMLRTGPYGEFRSCSNFPVCSYKPKRRVVDAATRYSQRAINSGFPAAMQRPASIATISRAR